MDRNRGSLENHSARLVENGWRGIRVNGALITHSGDIVTWRLRSTGEACCKNGPVVVVRSHMLMDVGPKGGVLRSVQDLDSIFLQDLFETTDEHGIETIVTVM